MDYWKWQLKLSSSWIYCELRVAVAEAWWQFGNPKKWERPPLEPELRGLMKRQVDWEDSVHAVMDFRVWKIDLEHIVMKSVSVQ
jgi:hypothetical protein